MSDREGMSGSPTPDDDDRRHARVVPETIVVRPHATPNSMEEIARRSLAGTELGKALSMYKWRRLSHGRGWEVGPYRVDFFGTVLLVRREWTFTARF